MVRTVEVWYSPDVWKKPIWYTLTISSEFAEGLKNLENVNVGYTLIDYMYIEPGLADYSVFSENLERMK